MISILDSLIILHYMQTIKSLGITIEGFLPETFRISQWKMVNILHFGEEDDTKIVT